MKNLLLILLTSMCIITCTSSCDKEEDDKTGMVGTSSTSWQIGATSSSNQDTTFTITSTGDLIKLIMTSNSYCPAYGVLYQVIDGDNILFEKTINDDFTMIDTLDLVTPVEMDKEYSIRTVSIENEENNVICVWQGILDCRLEY